MLTSIILHERVVFVVSEGKEMSRWNDFRSSVEDIPKTWYEAAVFVDNAYRHIRQSHPLNEDRLEAQDILGNAHNEINKSEGISIGAGWL